MIVRYRGESSPVGLINGKDYEVMPVERDWYRVVDETDEDHLYPPERFEIMQSTLTWPGPQGEP